MADLNWTDALTDDDIDRVRVLLAAVARVDGQPEVPPTGLPGEFRTGSHLLAGADPLTGYGHLDTAGDARGRPVGDAFVHPDARRAGLGSALVGALVERAGPELRVWARGDHPAAARIADTLGLHPVRTLLKLRLDLTAARRPPLPEPVWPAGITARTFVPGTDEAAMIEVNRAAFDWHPEQGALTVGDLLAAEAEDWFDPTGFFLAENADGRVVGFHWTKVHSTPDGPVGEVYVVGVHPDAQGGGLGRALTLIGLHHLCAAGLPEVVLYVEADNGPAVAVYRKLGFLDAAVNRQYAR